MDSTEHSHGAVRFSRIIQGCLLVYVFWLTLLYALFRNGELFNQYTAFLALLLGGVLYASLSWKRQYASEHTILLVVFVGIFFLTRILSYVAFPTLHLEIPGIYDVANINSALAFIILGVIAMVIGFKSADYLWKKWSGFRQDTESMPTAHLSPHAMAIVWFIIASIELYFMLYKGASSWDLVGIEEKPISGIWLIHLFSTDAIGIVTISLMAQQKNWFKTYRPYLIGFVVFYLIIMLLLGSRGGPMRVGTILLCALLAKYGDFKTTYRKFLLLMLLLFALNVAQFPAGTLTRYINMGNPLGQSQASSSQASASDEASISKAFRQAKASIANEDPLIFQIINRLGVLDYPVAVLSQQGDKGILDKYVTFGYSLKNVANNMVIGTPYPDHNIMTSRIFAAAYRRYSEDHVKEYMMSEPYTGWGISFILFGYTGGLVFLFILAILSQTTLNLVGKYMSRYKFVARSYFIYASTLAGLLMNFGIDHWMTFIFYSVISFMTTIGMIVFFQILFSRTTFKKVALAS